MHNTNGEAGEEGSKGKWTANAKRNETKQVEGVDGGREEGWGEKVLHQVTFVAAACC